MFTGRNSGVVKAKVYRGGFTAQTNRNFTIVFMLFACSLRTITANYPTFKQAKSMKTFNILLLNIGSHFKIFSLAAKALAGAWGAYIA